MIEAEDPLAAIPRKQEHQHLARQQAGEHAAVAEAIEQYSGEYRYQGARCDKQTRLQAIVHGREPGAGVVHHQAKHQAGRGAHRQGHKHGGCDHGVVAQADRHHQRQATNGQQIAQGQ